MLTRNTQLLLSCHTQVLLNRHVQFLLTLVTPRCYDWCRWLDSHALIRS